MGDVQIRKSTAGIQPSLLALKQMEREPAVLLQLESDAVVEHQQDGVWKPAGQYQVQNSIPVTWLQQPLPRPKRA